MPISEVESHISDRCSQDLFGGGGGWVRGCVGGELELLVYCRSLVVTVKHYTI